MKPNTDKHFSAFSFMASSSAEEMGIKLLPYLNPVKMIKMHADTTAQRVTLLKSKTTYQGIKKSAPKTFLPLKSGHL